MTPKERLSVAIEVAGLVMLGLLLPAILWFLLTQDLSQVLDFFRARD